ncbi:maltose O-acetyltransferase [Cellulophaga sp. RHA19]|uniref:acyltransferase n=1 Tax=Cellulophaga sp. RHA19 TaxID=1798237 RepID=UPI000C2BDD2E|nr:acyltransferase [Cellulophaga sp. RHA19]PKB42614.1 maltose O-acetyltransferase [Cellulophaga sp. RHA19]
MFSKLVKSKIIRTLYVFCSKIHSLFVDRVLSSLKFRALIKNSGEKCYCHYSVEIKYGQNISIGNNTRIGPNSTLGALGNIKIGSNVVVSKGVIIETAGLDFKSNSIPYKHKGKEITIGDNVWIGARAIILGGVHIGKDSIIGAGVVVSKTVPPNHILVGQQSRIIPKRS